MKKLVLVGGSILLISIPFLSFVVIKTDMLLAYSYEVAMSKYTPAIVEVAK